MAGKETDNADLEHQRIMDALSSAIDKPSALPQGTQIAGIKDEMAVLIAEEAKNKSAEDEAGLTVRTQAQQEQIDNQITQSLENNEKPGLVESIANAINATSYMNKDGTLLNSDNAVIDPNKINGYSLNPDHSKGSDKAIVFQSVLGYNQSNSDEMIQQLQQRVKTNQATPYKSNNYGESFTVDIPVKGTNGNTAIVRTGWIYDSATNSTTPRLTSAYIKK